MSNINLNTRTIFIHIPKTAGTSMSDIFWNKNDITTYYGHLSISYFAKLVDINKFYRWCFVRNPWERLLSGYDFAGEFKRAYPSFEEFVHVLYKHKTNYQKLNFLRFDSEKGWHNDDIPNITPNAQKVFLVSQKSLITINDKIQIDFIGRYENIQKDWVTLCNVMKTRKPMYARQEQWVNGLNNEATLPYNLVRAQESSCSYVSKPWREYYTKEMVDLVGEIYEQDIQQWKYKFD